ncbi:MAG: serine--tRNA ligase, partial [Pseudomonadota bacterium]
MFDIRWIRENADAFDAGLALRDTEPHAARLIELDEARRTHLQKLQDAQSRRNSASKEIGQAMGAGDTEKANALKAEVGDLKGIIQSGEEEERRIDEELNAILSTLPNLPLDEVPAGKDEADNVEVRRVGEARSLNFEARQHFEIGEALGLMDFETAARMSGARFTVLRGGLARLERAIGQFMLDMQTTEHGYTEVNPPLLVRDEALFGTGQLPKFADDLFHTSDDRWLIPTSE